MHCSCFILDLYDIVKSDITDEAKTSDTQMKHQYYFHSTALLKPDCVLVVLLATDTMLAWCNVNTLS